MIFTNIIITKYEPVWVLWDLNGELGSSLKIAQSVSVYNNEMFNEFNNSLNVFRKERILPPYYILKNHHYIYTTLPITEDVNRFIITFQDDLTKYSQAYATPNHEAKTVANALPKLISHVRSLKQSYPIPRLRFSLTASERFFQIVSHETNLNHGLSSTKQWSALERSHSTIIKDHLNIQCNIKPT